MPVYPLTVAGLHRELPICKISDELYIGAFICFGDAELTVACARDMLGLLDEGSYDYLFTAEAKSIPLIHEMARQSGAKKYFIARKGPKAYMPDPIHVEDTSITTWVQPASDISPSSRCTSKDSGVVPSVWSARSPIIFWMVPISPTLAPAFCSRMLLMR